MKLLERIRTSTPEQINDFIKSRTVMAFFSGMLIGVGIVISIVAYAFYAVK